jgi:hypothetical protein
MPTLQCRACADARRIDRIGADDEGAHVRLGAEAAGGADRGPVQAPCDAKCAVEDGDGGDGGVHTLMSSA